MAAGVTLLVVLAAVSGFSYVRMPSDNQRQTTEVSLITGNEKTFLDDLDYFDPANTFGVNNGGQPFCLFCRRSHHSDNCPGEEFAIILYDEEKKEIPVLTYDFKAAAPEKMAALSVTRSLPAVLPVPPEKEKMVHSHRIVADNGKVFSLAKLDAVKAGKVSSATTLQLSGSGLLTRVQIIRSCGDSKLDFTAGQILKAAGMTPGVYTVNWKNNGGN